MPSIRSNLTPSRAPGALAPARKTKDSSFEDQQTIDRYEPSSSGLNASNPGNTARRTSAGKPVVIQVDIDHTLIAWADRKNQIPEETGLREAIDELKTHEENAVVGISTARALAETTRLATMLAGVPLDFVAINSGQQLFFNKGGKPAEQFLKELDFNDVDAEWDSTLQEQHRWNGLKASVLLRHQLKESGFRKRENENLAQTEELYGKKGLDVRVQPDQTFFKFRVHKNGNKEDVESFMKDLHKLFQDNGLDCKLGGEYRWGRDLVRNLEPGGPNKSILLEHVVDRLPSTEFVLTAGDRADDVLRPKEVAGRPNYRVVAGSRKETKALRAQAGVARTERGFIAPGIQTQMNSISAIVLS